jgi:hypothetical protein
VRCLPRREASHGEPRAHRRLLRGSVGDREGPPWRHVLSTITRETIEGFQAKRKLDGVSNRTVNIDVGALRKVLKRYGHWRRLQDHVTMLSEAEGAPIGRALTPEEQNRLLDTAASNPEWEHVYCAAVLAANTSMRGVEVKHVRRGDIDLEKVCDLESATGKGVLYVGHSKNETSKRKLPPNGAARDAITRMLKRADELGGQFSGAESVDNIKVRAEPPARSLCGEPYEINARWLSARPLLFRPRKFLNAAGVYSGAAAAIRPSVWFRIRLTVT